MPRPAKHSGSKRFIAYPHTLGQSAKDKLRAFLNLDIAPSDSEDARLERESAEKAFDGIEYILGAYPDAVRALDHPPSAANYRDQVGHAGRHVLSLLVELQQLSDFHCDALKNNGADVGKLKLELGSFIDAASATVKQNLGTESRGHPKHVALEWVRTELRDIFSRYYPGRDDEPLSERKVNEAGFINTALGDAGIKADSDASDNRKKSTFLLERHF